MIKYITKEEFLNLIKDLPNTKRLDLSIESSYNGDEYICSFAYVDFNGGTYLYTTEYSETGVIQDTQVASFDEQLEVIWEDLTGNYDKPFIMIEDEPNSESS